MMESPSVVNSVASAVFQKTIPFDVMNCSPVVPDIAHHLARKRHNSSDVLTNLDHYLLVDVKQSPALNKPESNLESSSISANGRPCGCTIRSERSPGENNCRLRRRRNVSCTLAGDSNGTDEFPQMNDVERPGSWLQDLILNPCQLLDKVLVVCPNVDYCEEVLPRSDLEAHLAHRCKGSSTRCLRADVGCNFLGPRSNLSEHLREWPFGNQTQEMEAVGKAEVNAGEISTIDIQRGCYDLGLTIVGGIDTPLMCVVIQEVFQDGVVFKDGRLLPGDQILEVNGLDLTSATHSEAKCALCQIYPITRLVVYREMSEEHCPIEKEEIVKVALPKAPGKPLGLKLIGKFDAPGLFIAETVSGGSAYADSRLKKDDQILQISGQDVAYATQEQAARIIHSSRDKVHMVIRRKSRHQDSPDLIRSTTQSDRFSGNNMILKDTAGFYPIKPLREKHVSVTKEPNESLGISVVGGCGNPRGSLPIYVTNMQSGGCLHRSKQLQKGDVLLSINGHSLLERTHIQAVSILKMAAVDPVVTLKVLQGPETSDGIANFIPTWHFWLSMPIACQSPRVITLERSDSGAFGFSIVGGADSSCGAVPIYVKSVVFNTPAGSGGLLRSGDQLLSVNGQSLDVPHSAAVRLLKRAGECVSLVVVSWPGTPV